MLKDERSRRSVDAAESWAEGVLPKIDLSKYQIQAQQAQDEYTTSAPGRAIDATADALGAATCVALPAKEWVKTVANCVRGAKEKVEGRQGLIKAEKLQCSHLRCIFGPFLFRSVDINPGCRTPKIIAIAQTIYDERRFGELPNLAVALEEVGCTNTEMLAHCRDPEEHVRGCWVLDLILGKE